MKLKKNIISNYVAQGYIAILGIIVIPYYIKYMGLEAYGLVGIFLLIQTIFQLFDIGVSASIQREASKIRISGVNSQFKIIFQVFETYFFIIGITASVLMLTFSNEICEKWMNSENLNKETVNFSLKIMAVILFFRWFSCLYRGVILGREDQVWLNKVNILISTFKYFMVIPIIALRPKEPSTYFLYQLFISIIEFTLLYIRAKYLVNEKYNFKLNFNYKAVKSILKFSVGIGITGIVWAFVTQFDKLILSKVLTLSDYGIFSMVTTLSGGVLMLATPLGTAIIPRLTSIISSGDEINYRKIYSNFSRLVVLVTFPAALILAIFSKKIIEIWTGNREFAEDGYIILGLYTLGNALVNIASIPFSIQYALGNIKYHVIGNLLFSVIYIPIIYFVAEKFGAIGTGIAWISLNIAYIFFWIPLIHKKLNIKSFWSWFKDDIFIPILIAIIPIAFLYNAINNSTEKYYSISIILTAWILSTFGIIITVKEFREYALKGIK